ncbi:hypothetical protein SFOMI_0703 [Sphingobium fuliginis]|uniref:Uncharacterized protein n=1 Tax=Sphingobium fuliginis (strain ATCC 27551) TaxID=336203 RepID=A0A292ZBB1_SPHSA|nr:hypothetical protein SFOMI_0703 [Sphingobium fuliginis]
MLRFTQVDRECRANVVTFSEHFDVRRGVFDVAARPTSPLTMEG